MACYVLTADGPLLPWELDMEKVAGAAAPAQLVVEPKGLGSFGNGDLYSLGRWLSMAKHGLYDSSGAFWSSIHSREQRMQALRLWCQAGCQAEFIDSTAEVSGPLKPLSGVMRRGSWSWWSKARARPQGLVGCARLRRERVCQRVPALPRPAGATHLG